MMRVTACFQRRADTWCSPSVSWIGLAHLWETPRPSGGLDMCWGRAEMKGS